MKTRNSFLNTVTGTILISTAVFQIGCSGGGFNSQDAIRAKQPEKATAEFFPLPDPSGPQVPEIVAPDDKPKTEPDNGDVVTPPPVPEQPILDDAGQPVAACSEEYRVQHNEIYELMQKLEAYNKSEKTPEQTTETIANARLAAQKCAEFAKQFAETKCKAKLKSHSEPVVASYKELLQGSCEKVTEAVSKLDSTPQTPDPAVDPTKTPDVLTQDLEALTKDQIIEMKIKDSSALLAGSNKDANVESVWVDGQVQKISQEEAMKLVAEEKKSFCAVTGFVEVSGEGTIAHRAVSAKNLEEENGIKAMRIEFTSYLTGPGAGDNANAWTVTCYGATEVFKPNLETLSKIMGSTLEAEIVGPKQ